MPFTAYTAQDMQEAIKFSARVLTLCTRDLGEQYAYNWEWDAEIYASDMFIVITCEPLPGNTLLATLVQEYGHNAVSARNEEAKEAEEAEEEIPRLGIQIMHYFSRGNGVTA